MDAKALSIISIAFLFYCNVVFVVYAVPIATLLCGLYMYKKKAEFPCSLCTT